MKRVDPALAAQSLLQFLDHPTPQQLADRLVLALEGASLGVWDWNLRDNSVHFDHRWCEMIGLDFAQARQELKTWEERVHPDDLGFVYAAIQAYLRGETPYYESIHRMRHTEGHWVHILDRGRVSAWDAAGVPIRFTGTHFDVTAQEEARHELANERDVLQEIVGHLPMAVALLDQDLKYLSISSQWLGHSPLKPEKLLGQLYSETLDGVPFFKMSEPWLSLFERVLLGESFSSERATYTCFSGDSMTVRWRMRPWGARAGGKARGVLIVTEDTTRQTEVELQSQHSAKLAALGEMAGSIAHEINTPLATIGILSAQMAEILRDLENSAEFKESLHELQSKASLIESTISRISKK